MRTAEKTKWQLQTPITLNSSRGKSNENWPGFESLLSSLINVGNIAAANQQQFLQLHSIDQGLHFFRTLTQATRDKFELSITALGNHYCYLNLRELHKLELKNLNFDQKASDPKTLWC